MYIPGWAGPFAAFTLGVVAFGEAVRQLMPSWLEWPAGRIAVIAFLLVVAAASLVVGRMLMSVGEGLFSRSGITFGLMAGAAVNVFRAAIAWHEWHVEIGRFLGGDTSMPSLMPATWVAAHAGVAIVALVVAWCLRKRFKRFPDADGGRGVVLAAVTNTAAAEMLERTILGIDRSMSVTEGVLGVVIILSITVGIAVAPWRAEQIPGQWPGFVAASAVCLAMGVERLLAYIVAGRYEAPAAALVLVGLGAVHALVGVVLRHRARNRVAT